MRIDSSAPTRIDLAGGTYDIWPIYLFHERAQTINAALTLRARATLTSRRDYRIRLVSDDTGEHVDVADLGSLTFDRLPLVARLVKYFGARGLDVHTRSGSPVGAGIAGSSALNIALAGALAAWTGRTLEADALLTIAMNVEAQVIGVPTGVQDYRPAYYGGVSAVELEIAGVRRRQIDVDPEALGQRVVLAYTGASRQSGINNWEVTQRRIEGDPVVIDAFNGIRDAAAGVRAALEQADWLGLSRHLDAEWQHRKRLAPGVTTPEIDGLLAAARGAGATAGKVCGAGGGGCLFCLTPPEKRTAVADTLERAGARILPAGIDANGLQIERG